MAKEEKGKKNKEEEEENIKESPKGKEKEETKGGSQGNFKANAKEFLISAGHGLVMFFKALMVIAIAFLKAITMGFFQNIKVGWSDMFRKKEEAKAKKK